jgi:hypothetical protein
MNEHQIKLEICKEYFFAVGPALGHCKLQQIKTSMAPM